MKAFSNRIGQYNIAAWYYPLLALVYALTLVSFSLFRPGVVSSISVVVIWAWLILSGMLPGIRSFNTPDIIMSAWFIYNILSGIWAVCSGLPMSVPLGELFTAVLPMVFYYIAAYGSEDQRLRFYELFIAAVLLLGVLGIVLYLAAPDFYIDYLFKYGFISKADIQTMRVRMVSVTGSTVLGFLGVAAMPVSVGLFIRTKKRLWCAALVLAALIAFMSNQRAAMSAAILVMVYFNILVFFVYKRLDKRYFFIELGVAAAGVLAVFLAARGAFMKVFYRLISLPLAIGERSDQWVGAANNMRSIWTGNGLGANGHRAIGYAEHVIADGGLAKLYCEMGIIGTALFAFLMLLVLKRGFKNIEKLAPELCVVLITLIVSIGSNVLSFALSVPIFYFAVGMLSTVSVQGSDTPLSEDVREGGRA